MKAVAVHPGTPGRCTCEIPRRSIDQIPDGRGVHGLLAEEIDAAWKIDQARDRATVRE
jgi:hypothetical protein